PRTDLLVDRGDAAQGIGVARIDLEDQLAHGDRLHEEPALRVALRRAGKRADRLLVLAQAAVRLRRALGPLRIPWLALLELQVGSEGALVLAGCRRIGSVGAQLANITSHRRKRLYSRRGSDRTRRGGARLLPHAGLVSRGNSRRDR